MLAGSVARADEDGCAELAENACFYMVGNFVVQAWVGVQW